MAGERLAGGSGSLGLTQTNRRAAHDTSWFLKQMLKLLHFTTSSLLVALVALAMLWAADAGTTELSLREAVVQTERDGRRIEMINVTFCAIEALEGERSGPCRARHRPSPVHGR